MSVTKQVYYMPDIMALAGRSRWWVEESIRNKTLPTPIRIGKRNSWPKVVIDRLFGLDNTATQPAHASEAGK